MLASHLFRMRRILHLFRGEMLRLRPNWPRSDRWAGDEVGRFARHLLRRGRSVLVIAGCDDAILEAAGLAPPQPRIGTVAGEELGMTAGLDDAPALEHDQPVH